MSKTGYRQAGVNYREPGLPYNGVLGDAPPGASLAFFLPPIETSPKVPPWPRVPEIPRRSQRYRAFYGNQLGKDVTISGILYRGGRWNGPLSSAEVSAITTAGYGARIRSIQPERWEQLPATLDGPLP